MSDRHLIAAAHLRGERAGTAELREYVQASGRPLYLLTTSWTDERGNGHNESSGYADRAEATRALAAISDRRLERADLEAASLHHRVDLPNSQSLAAATPGGPPHVEQVFAGPATCTRCGGHGQELWQVAGWQQCPACGGTGVEPLAG